MTAGKRCPRCGLVRPAGEFYRRQGNRRPAGPSAAPPGPSHSDELRAVDRVRQRRRRALRGQDPSGGDAA